MLFIKWLYLKYQNIFTWIKMNICFSLIDIILPACVYIYFYRPSLAQRSVFDQRMRILINCLFYSVILQHFFVLWLIAMYGNLEYQVRHVSASPFSLYLNAIIFWNKPANFSKEYREMAWNLNNRKLKHYRKTKTASVLVQNNPLGQLTEWKSSEVGQTVPRRAILDCVLTLLNTFSLFFHL